MTIMNYRRAFDVVLEPSFFALPALEGRRSKFEEEEEEEGKAMGVQRGDFT